MIPVARSIPWLGAPHRMLTHPGRYLLVTGTVTSAVTTLSR